MTLRTLAALLFGILPFNDPLNMRGSILAIGALVGLAVYASRSYASIAPSIEYLENDAYDPSTNNTIVLPGNQLVHDSDPIFDIELDAAMFVQNEPVAAFLYVIRSCENSESSVSSGMDYYTLYGGNLFSDDSDHPANLGWRGTPLGSNYCSRAGLSSGCVSTAAGAYQINRPTWDDFRKRGVYLSNFGPYSQDECARRILESTGAIDYIRNGQIDKAIRAASKRWASLPGSTSGQRQKSVDYALAKYQEGLYA